MKKYKYFIWLLIIALIGCSSYYIRHRPSRNFVSYLDSNTPILASKEGNRFVEQSKIQMKSYFDFVIYDNPTDSAVVRFLDEKRCDIMMSPMDSSFAKYNISDINEQ